MIWTFGEIKNDFPTDPYNLFWNEKIKEETKEGESLEDVFFSVEDIRVRDKRKTEQSQTCSQRIPVIYGIEVHNENLDHKKSFPSKIYVKR